MTPALLENCLSHFRNPVVITDCKGRVLFKNPSFDDFFVHGEKSGNLLGILKHNSVLLESYQRTIESKGTYSLWDTHVELANGTIKKLDVDSFPLINDQDRVHAVCLFFYDRTLSSRVEEHQKRLDRISYLATIASGLAHEIRNPLSGIKGASQLLMDAFKDESDLKQYATIIQKEVVRVDKLLQDLMTFSKPRPLKKDHVNINQVLYDLVLLQKTIDIEKIEITEEFDPSLPGIIGDGAALSQVFLNLIKNARQSIQGSGKITVRSRIMSDFRLKKGEKMQQLIVVDIEDTGCGMSPEILSRIFVPFYTTKSQGTGLGLSLCHQIIEEHGGDVQIKSEPQKGSCFSVFLPV